MPAPANRPLRLIDGAGNGAAPRVRRTAGVTFWAETLFITTERAHQFIDLTAEVTAVVRRSGVQQGWVSVFSKHTTAAVLINEDDPRLFEDMSQLLDRLAAAGPQYQHPDNGHAHCQHLVLSSSEHIPIAAGSPDLGTWQRIFFLELDRSRDRQVVVQVFGA